MKGTSPMVAGYYRSQPTEKFVHASILLTYEQRWSRPFLQSNLLLSYPKYRTLYKRKSSILYSLFATIGE